MERKKRAYIGNIAYIKYLSGGEYFKYMTVEEIKAHAQNTHNLIEIKWAYGSQILR